MIFLCLIILFLNDKVCFATLLESDNSLPYNNYDLPIKINLANQLRNKITEKQKTEERLRTLNEQIAKDTEYFEDIPHLEVKSSKKMKGKEENILKDFRHVIGMVGVKYTYKRDLHWRTWREVTYPSKEREIICYRCQNNIEVDKRNCTSCDLGGYWVIEENRPSCSYEIFSFKNKNELCAAYFWELKAKSSCPTIISYDQLVHCDIPIITHFLITRDYSKNISERALPAICQGRENCDISTVYNVNPGSIVFRIINTTNHIIYSRIMKDNGENYACFDDCGNFDFDTKTATRNEDHLVLNLLNQSIKKKRHNHNPRHEKPRNYKKTKNLITSLKDVLKHDKIDKSKSVFKKEDLFVNNNKHGLEQTWHRERSKVTSEHPSICKQLMNDYNKENADE